MTLALPFFWLEMRQPGGNSWTAAEIFAGATVLFAMALRGIRVRIKDGALAYRNMLYLTQHCLLADITQCEVRWETVYNQGASHDLLMLVVKLPRTDAIRIPLQYFSRPAQSRLRELLGAEGDADVRRS